MSLRVSVTQQAQILRAPIWTRQRRWQRGRMRQQWSCLPCSVKSMTLIRWGMELSSATRRDMPGASPAITGIRSIFGRNWTWDTPWTRSAKRSVRPWKAAQALWRRLLRRRNRCRIISKQ